MRKNILRSLLAFLFVFVAVSADAQIKYRSDGKLTIGNTNPYDFYPITTHGNGMYMKCKTSNFFQIDCTPSSPRLAGHSDQIVFYNTATSKFNSIQVQNVYNYSDARAKTAITPLNNCLSKVKQIKAYSYKFANDDPASPYVKGGNGNEYGFLAQELEKVFPELVITDPDGNKLVNNIGLIAILLQSVQELSKQLEAAQANSK